MDARTSGWTVAALVMVASVFGETTIAAQPRTAPAPPTRPSRRIVVSFEDRKLALVEDGVAVLVLPVAIGAPETPTPAGTFVIVNRLTNPTYYGKRQVIAPGPSNPLGTRWMGLNVKGYGLHGTDDPRSIGYAKSHGCIRLRNADAERLFARVRTGDLVEMHDTRTLEIASIFDTRRVAN